MEWPHGRASCKGPSAGNGLMAHGYGRTKPIAGSPGTAAWMRENARTGELRAARGRVRSKVFVVRGFTRFAAGRVFAAPGSWAMTASAVMETAIHSARSFRTWTLTLSRG